MHMANSLPNYHLRREKESCQLRCMNREQFLNLTSKYAGKRVISGEKEEPRGLLKACYKKPNSHLKVWSICYIHV